MDGMATGHQRLLQGSREAPGAAPLRADKDHRISPPGGCAPPHFRPPPLRGPPHEYAGCSHEWRTQHHQAHDQPKPPQALARMQHVDEFGHPLPGARRLPCQHQARPLIDIAFPLFGADGVNVGRVIGIGKGELTQPACGNGRKGGHVGRVQARFAAHPGREFGGGRLLRQQLERVGRHVERGNRGHDQPQSRKPADFHMHPAGDRPAGAGKQPPPAAHAPRHQEKPRDRQHQHCKRARRRRQPPAIAQKERTMQACQPLHRWRRGVVGDALSCGRINHHRTGDIPVKIICGDAARGRPPDLLDPWVIFRYPGRQFGHAEAGLRHGGRLKLFPGGEDGKDRPADGQNQHQSGGKQTDVFMHGAQHDGNPSG